MTNAAHVAEYGRQLQVHRTTPGSLYSLAGCVTLCVRCHGPKPKAKWGTATNGALSIGVTSTLAARVRRQADRFGMSVSAYIRAKTTEALEKDEVTDEPLKTRKTRKP
jgi:hypothetical protein